MIFPAILIYAVQEAQKQRAAEEAERKFLQARTKFLSNFVKVLIMDTQILQSQIAVMQAAAKGKRIELRDRHHPDLRSWVACKSPAWDWNSTEYRVDPTDVDLAKAPLDRSTFDFKLVWVRFIGVGAVPNHHYLVTSICDLGFKLNSSLPYPAGMYHFSSPKVLNGMEYTLDGKLWLPFYKMVPVTSCAS